MTWVILTFLVENLGSFPKESGDGLAPVCQAQSRSKERNVESVLRGWWIFSAQQLGEAQTTLVHILNSAPFVQSH